MIKTDNFWVFAYGSLIWRPGFRVAERRRAVLRGYRRAFALLSVHYRGTPEAPGLVLGLDWDPNAACEGMALRVAGEEAEAVRAYLQERELVARSYFEVQYPVTILCEGPQQGEAVPAIVYVLDRTHPQYAGRMPAAERAAIIARAVGPNGTNRSYLESTRAALAEAGITCPELEELAGLVARL